MPEETTTTVAEAEELIAGDQIDGDGVPLWMILLPAALVLAVLTIAVFAIRRRRPVLDHEPPPPPPAIG